MTRTIKGRSDAQCGAERMSQMEKMRVTIATPFGKMHFSLEPKQASALLDQAMQYAGYPEPDRDGYKGFLGIQCEDCGNTKWFCTKKPIRSYICDCGHTTELHDLKPLYAECRCGQRSKYQTNIAEDRTSLNCLSCGGLIRFKLNQTGTAFVTVHQKER